jgi:hypothetical protein
MTDQGAGEGRREPDFSDEIVEIEWLRAQLAEADRALGTEHRAGQLLSERICELLDAIRWASQINLRGLTMCITNESWNTRCEDCEACTIWESLAAPSLPKEAKE